MKKLLAIVRLLALVAVASAQPYDCDKPLPRNFTSPIGPFILSWGMVNDTVIELQWALPGTAYTAFGWGNSMTLHDCYIGWVETATKFVIQDAFSLTHIHPPEDTSLGGKNNVQMVCGARIGTMTVLRFRRALNTGDKYDAVLPKTGAQQVFYAWNSGAAGHVADHHLNKNHVTVTLGDANGEIPFI